MKGSTRHVPGKPTRSFVPFLRWRPLQEPPCLLGLSLEGGPRPARSVWMGDMRRRCSGHRTPRITVSPPKGTTFAAPTLLPSQATISVFCKSVCHRIQSSSYLKPSSMSESRRPEFQSRLKLPLSTNSGVSSGHYLIVPTPVIGTIH